MSSLQSNVLANFPFLTWLEILKFSTIIQLNTSSCKYVEEPTSNALMVFEIFSVFLPTSLRLTVRLIFRTLRKVVRLNVCLI